MSSLKCHMAIPEITAGLTGRMAYTEETESPQPLTFSQDLWFRNVTAPTKLTETR